MRKEEGASGIIPAQPSDLTVPLFRPCASHDDGWRRAPLVADLQAQPPRLRVPEMGSRRRSRKAARHVAELLLRADALYTNGDRVATDFMLHDG